MARRTLITIGIFAAFVMIAAGSYALGVYHGGDNAAEGDVAGTPRPTQAEDEPQPPPKNFRTYTDDDLGTVFAYPSEWGKVSRTKNDSSLTVNNQTNKVRTVSYKVGPLFVLGSSKDTDKQTGDDMTTRLSKGYVKEGDDYYARFERQGESGDDAAPLGQGVDLFEELQGPTGTVLILSDGCADAIGCSLDAVLNTNNEDYPGLSVRYDQSQTENSDEAVRQLKAVLSTFRFE